jgi:hypothetical protein
MTASRLARLAPIAAGSWAALNGLLYAADATRRYRAESAWFVFAAVLIATALLAISSGEQEQTPVAARPRVFVGIAFLLGAALLYLPMLSIGLLSDDFTLFARSRAGALADPAWEFLRPLPLAIWRFVSEIRFGDQPWMLHAINIGLHGVNACLTSMLAARFGLPRRLALLAGIVFLVNPAAVEAVAWASGIFDVLLTTLILASCVLLTTATSRVVASIAIAMLTVAALMTKETAVVMPAMLAIAAISSPHTTVRRAAVPIAVSAIVLALYFPIRIISGHVAVPPAANMSGYVLKEVLSRPFGTLGLPFHVEFVRSQPWVPFAFALVWPALFAVSAARWRRHRTDATQILACGAWILVSVLPLATMLFIADDLQGARYVYLGAAASSILLAVLLRAYQPSQQVIFIVPLIALFIVATRAHQSAWSDAARERDRVLAAYRSSAISCAPEGARGLPEHVRGAYVFRNGFAEAARMMTPGLSDRSCVAVWDGTRFTPN